MKTATRGNGPEEERRKLSKGNKKICNVKSMLLGAKERPEMLLEKQINGIRHQGNDAERREDEVGQLVEGIERTLDAQKREEAKTAESKAQEQEHRCRNILERTLKGIQPEVWPTEEQFRSAKARIQYDSEKLHFAVYESSGSGKSSLINAFRGLTNNEPGAAPAGIIETTLSVTRYPDPHDNLPHILFGSMFLEPVP